MKQFGTERFSTDPFGTKRFGVGGSSSTWSPLDPSGLIDWWQSYTPATITKDEADIVSNWSGAVSGINISMATIGHQPLWMDNQINGYPTIYFNEAEYLQGALSSNYTQPNTLVLVMSMPPVGGNYVVAFDGDDLVNRHFLLADGHVGKHKWAMFAGSMPYTTYPDNESGYKVLIAVFNVASSMFFVNGVDYSPVTTVGTDTMDGISIGGENSGSLFIESHYTDFILYNSLLSAEDRAAMNTYFMTRYGL